MNRLALTLVLVVSTTATAVVQQKQTAISSGWVKLPAAGATETAAYLVVDNPTQYDVFLQKASSDAAGAVEFRAAGKPEPLTFVTVPAYESLEMDEKGTYLAAARLEETAHRRCDGAYQRDDRSRRAADRRGHREETVDAPGRARCSDCSAFHSQSSSPHSRFH